MADARKMNPRQPAIRLFADEFNQSTLHRQGSAEYDPSFVITRLGTKVNRMVVAGSLERLEHQDTEGGGFYRGSVRDPTGLYFFSAGTYTMPVYEKMSVIYEKHQAGEPILLLLVGKSRYRQGDDGSVYTNIRVEEVVEIGRDVYANWLVEASDSTLERISLIEKTRSLDSSMEAWENVDVSAEVRDGLILARGHYGEVETEDLMLGIRRALDRAVGGMESTTEIPKFNAEGSSSAEDAVVTSGKVDDAKEAMIELVQVHDQGEGVDFQSLISGCEAKGFTRDDANDALTQLTGDGILLDHKFGWYRHIDAS